MIWGSEKPESYAPCDRDVDVGPQFTFSVNVSVPPIVT